MHSDDQFMKMGQPQSVNAFVKKSLSTLKIGAGNQNLSVREAKSFTGALQELKPKPVENGNHEGAINCHKQIYTDTKTYKDQANEGGYETREIASNQTYFVEDKMLTYRGKRYSLSDIATKWKKDCRMWLWKSNKSKMNKSVGELREKLQNVKIHN